MYIKSGLFAPIVNYKQCCPKLHLIKLSLATLSNFGCEESPPLTRKPVTGDNFIARSTSISVTFGFVESSRSFLAGVEGSPIPAQRPLSLRSYNTVAVSVFA
jgi:hypothetical protein